MIGTIDGLVYAWVAFCFVVAIYLAVIRRPRR